MITYRVRIAPSPIQGAGVFAAEKIHRRAKIGEVTGEIISIKAARQRARGRCTMCLIDLSDKRALDCTKGNALRLINHSCRSNAFLRIFRDRVEVYAQRDIRKGEEITVDYVESPHSGGMKCRCGHKECRNSI
jgi:uncharacterized protein